MQHATIACERTLDLVWVEAAHLEKVGENGDINVSEEEYASAWEKMKSADGVIVPGGFGNRWVCCLMH